MECPACTRHDQRAFYCSSCLTNRCARSLKPHRRHLSLIIYIHRLAEHYSRRKQYRDALTLATAKASALLQPPASSNALGVREESSLKAEKWTLATRLRDLRVASEKMREGMAAGEFFDAFGSSSGAC